MSKIYVDEIAGIASADTVAIPGHVIQVVEGTTTTPQTFTSGSFADTNLSVTITPTSTSSKILVTANPSAWVANSSAADGQGYFRVVQSARDITGEVIFRTYDYGNSGSQIQAPFTLQRLDEPETTNSITYTLQMRAGNGNGVRISNDNYISVITAMEIAG